MKKLMVAVALVCAAAIAEAGSVKWTAVDIDSPDSGFAYLFNSADVGYADIDTIIAAIAGGSFDSTYAGNAAYSLDFADGEISQLNAITGISGSTTLWMVALDDESDPTKAFVGEEITMTVGSSGTKTFEWAYADNTSDWTAVPEPTSGLLMLLGMAGLALRRKRA